MQEFVDLLFGFVTFDAIAFLQLTDHYFHLTLDLDYVVVGKLPPPLPNVAFHLVPSAFQNVRIHVKFSFIAELFRIKQPL
jgi:hypothetical protein